jgi:hypothetical protein
VFSDNPESTATSAKATGTRPPTGSPTVHSSAKKSTNVGAIAGGVVGGIVALGLIAALAVWFIVRRRRSRVAPSAAYGAGYNPALSPTSPPPMSQHATEYSHYSTAQLNPGQLSPAPRLYVRSLWSTCED